MKGQDGYGKERVWENLRPRSWFFQSGAAQNNRHAKRARYLVFAAENSLSNILETEESVYKVSPCQETYIPYLRKTSSVFVFLCCNAVFPTFWLDFKHLALTSLHQTLIEAQ